MVPVLVSVALAILALSPQTSAPPVSSLQREVNREEARKHYRAGERLMAREAFEKAVDQFRITTELDPDYVLGYYSMGQAFMALRRYPDALVAFVGARDTLLRQSHLDQGAQAEAERDRRDLINKLEDSLQVVRAGKIKGTGGSTIALETGIEQRLTLLQDAEMKTAGNEPRIPAELSLALGSAYYHQGQLEEAEREYRSAIRRNAGLGAAHNNLAVVCMTTGRLDEARKEITAAEEAGFMVAQRFKNDLHLRELEARQ